jgi:prepilin-type N-terminal cleavage/methylation domain-containing protein
MRTYYKFRGFTLVELLVVISIIGMLAGLLLPAIQAAREAGRRATCINNQSQVAFACLNFDGNRGCLPPLEEAVSGTNASWVKFLLPYVEQNKAWEVVSNGGTLGDITLVSFVCKSSGKTGAGANTSYVANGGEWNKPDKEPGNKKYAVFFDHAVPATGGGDANATKVSVDYISQKDGTSVTLLLSEKVEKVDWRATGTPAEQSFGFAFPTGATADVGYVDNGTAPTFGDTTILAINRSKGGEGDSDYKYARPSANHPGIVVAAFADRHVQALQEGIDSLVYARLMQTDSDDIIDASKIE